MDIDTQIELERGLLQTCSEELMQKIVEYGKEFYEHLFRLFELELSATVMAQKESFIVATTRYYILNRLKTFIKPTYKQTNKFELMFNRNAPLITKVYEPIPCSYYEQPLKEHLTILIEMAQERGDKNEFARAFASTFPVRKMLFQKELEANRDNSMTNFAKGLKAVMENTNNNDCL